MEKQLMDYPYKFCIGQIWYYNELSEFGECILYINSIKKLINFNSDFIRDIIEIEITALQKNCNLSKTIRFFYSTTSQINEPLYLENCCPLIWKDNGEYKFCLDDNIWRKAIYLDKNIMSLYKFILPKIEQDPNFVRIEMTKNMIEKSKDIVDKVSFIYDDLKLKIIKNKCERLKKVTSGLNCKKCQSFYEMAESNQNDGTLICWSCRNGF